MTTINDRCLKCGSGNVYRIIWSDFGYDLICRDCGFVQSIRFGVKKNRDMSKITDNKMGYER